MTPKKYFCLWRPVTLCLFVFLLIPPSAYSQVMLTGAIEFATSSNGTASTCLVWNTLGGDTWGNLWLALDPNAALHINGPSDAQAGISIPLRAGADYKFYTFAYTLGTCSSTYLGLNLFFNGNNSDPGISVFGPVNTKAFLPMNTSTFSLSVGYAAGSGTSLYKSGNEFVLLDGYTFNTPATPPGNVCQTFVFSPNPNGDADLFGSFSLHVFPAAVLSINQTEGSPLSILTIMGSGFAPSEIVNIHAETLTSALLGTATTDASGSFSVKVLEPPHAYGSLGFLALGKTSGNLGAANISVTAAIRAVPRSVEPGGVVATEGLGFGAGESVKVYLDSPRQLLGTATANEVGSFANGNALPVTIPANASAGLNALVAIGDTTGAVGIGKLTVK